MTTLWALTGLALTERERGDLDRSGRLWGAVTAERELDPLSPQSGLAEFAKPLAEESDAAFRAAFEEGRSLPLDGAVALALGEKS